VIAGYFRRVQRGRGGRKKIALVATGHYLLRVMLSMLRTGEVWRGCAPEGLGPMLRVRPMGKTIAGG